MDEVPTKEYPEAIPGEQVYVDYDDEHEMWGVFGEESGHCYTSRSSEEEASTEARLHNDALWS
jgi:hypothetical protein